jgi:hypothetical protein
MFVIGCLSNQYKFHCLSTNQYQVDFQSDDVNFSNERSPLGVVARVIQANFVGYVLTRPVMICEALSHL